MKILIFSIITTSEVKQIFLLTNDLLKSVEQEKSEREAWMFQKQHE